MGWTPDLQLASNDAVRIEEAPMQVTTIGLDIAKSVFRVQGADVRSNPVNRRRLRRREVLHYFANIEKV